MSYCRWSTPNCDLYCYESVGDFYQIYVAGYRQRLWYDFWLWSNARRIKIEGRTVLFPRRYLFKLPHWVTHKKIRIKLDKDSFAEDTIEDFYARVKWLRGLGYRVPDYVLLNIEQELSEK